MITNLKLVIIISIVFIACAKEGYNPLLVDYLKAERELRRRVDEENGLSDSITVLQQEYNIDIEKEMSQLNKDPETWLKLIEELKIEK